MMLAAGTDTGPPPPRVAPDSGATGRTRTSPPRGWTGTPARWNWIAWIRPGFLPDGALDPASQASLQVVTEQGEERWLGEREVTGPGAPALVKFFLPFMGGGAVLVGPGQERGEVRSWAVTGRRLRTHEAYHVHLAGTPAWDEIEVDVSDLEPRI